jgi:NAD(P)-dependent dehydrogenase (short-subunit alcohol dehydrogenase family)
VGLLNGKVALVSGASRGIGQAIAWQLADAGARVALLDLRDCAETLGGVQERGQAALAIGADVRLPSAWASAVKTVSSELGNIDLLANVAGVVNTPSPWRTEGEEGPDSVVDLTESGWDYVIDTNLKSVWLGMQAVIPMMQRGGGGRIINISSLAALRGLPGLAAYSASKGGVIALTRQAAVEYGPEILINAIAPGTILTPMSGELTEEEMAAYAAAHIIPRLGTPLDIAQMAVHLLGPGGDFVTGQTMPVDGGWHAL